MISALPPEKFQKFVRIIRKFETALGSSDLKLTPEEEVYRKKMIKSVVALSDLAPGSKLTRENIALKRIPVFDESKHLTDIESSFGKTLSSPIKHHSPIKKEDISQ